MEQNANIVELISQLLDAGKYKEAVSVPNDEKYINSFKDNCWDLISIIISKIQDDTIVIKPSLHGACEELLAAIIQKSAPEEALLEFIEQIELSKNDAQFSIILTPLQQLLKKLSVKRGRSLEWCLNSISTYIETIPVPELQLEGKERLLMDSDPNIRRITKVYSMLPSFYSPFVNELNVPDSNIRTKQIIAAFLISLLGKPLIYIDLDPDNSLQSEARHCCAIILKDICTLEKNICKLFPFVEACYNEEQKSMISKRPQVDSEEEISPYKHKEKVNMTTLSGLLYAVFSGHFEIPDFAVPQVYSIEYIVHTVILSIIHLLHFTEYGPLAKASSLCKASLSRLQNNASYTLLSSPIYFKLCEALVKVAIYSTYESIRKNSVTLIGILVEKFEYKGRCMLIKYLIDSCNHSGMIGFAITLYKNAVNEAFKDPSLQECFKGVQLIAMIKKICYLPHGAESDLVEMADQIITSLNFLRYLALKDTDNITGIRDQFSTIESDYLDKLRTGLNMSKAHYELKLKELEEGKSISGDKVDIQIHVGGTSLDTMPLENKKEVIHSALNAFYLIEGLVARLSECIHINKMLKPTMNSFRSGRKYILPLASVPVRNKSYLITRKYCQNNNIEKEIKAPAVLEQDEQQYEESIKNKILEKALEFVPKSGWSVESISAGAEAVGYPTISHGLFPNGGGDLVHYFNVRCNEKLVEEMKSWPKEELKETTVPTKFIENAIMTRLLMIDPYKSTWPKAIAIQTLPNNVPNCLATLLSLVDDICYHSGDRSVDFNWYLRRVGLAGIYKASELFYLTDKTQLNSDTRNFVISRIRDAQLIQTALNLNPVSAAPQTLTAAFVTAKNILGMNTLK